ncbi:hypothetical protein [Tuwongella immobilis]|uniref:Peptidase C39-like domain-containing protein n=1 Tax=Tuwongella immobilis TaxID=692036 RepID=A0A6C2YNT8_9BACT|nr:hypothetical protein [Tuwongella immobilis]VIP03054.1 unnamed protein product [Tuwongella immobilis]VTS03249.1 unnamed protein product [Tuwongella immobilis]
MRLKWIFAFSTIVLAGIALAGPSTVGGPTFQGESLTVDLPVSEHIRNIGSRVDGAGMCVNSSLEMAARWAGMEDWRGFRDWSAQWPGGSYPGKVDEQIAAYAKLKGLEPPRYVQYEGKDPAPILALADKTGRMASVTYGRSPRYGGTIYHMVCCPKFGSKSAAILDNNFPGNYEWMSPDEAVSRIKHATGQGWVHVWLTPPPPPPPTN